MEAGLCSMSNPLESEVIDIGSLIKSIQKQGLTEAKTVAGNEAAANDGGCLLIFVVWTTLMFFCLCSDMIMRESRFCPVPSRSQSGLVWC